MLAEQKHCVYLKIFKKLFLILTIYGDNILMTSNYKKMVEATKRSHSSQFDIKDRGEVAYVIGVKILWNHTEKTIIFLQQMYEECFKTFKFK